jgi:hypothetical protein
MPRSEDDREATDRAFAEIVAGYHLTAERPDPLSSGPLAAESRATDSRSADLLSADSRGAEQQGADLLRADPPPLTSEQRGGDQRGVDPIVGPSQDTAPQQAAPVEPRVDDPPEQPLFRFVPYVPSAADPATADRALPSRAAAEPPPEQLERFVPPPLEPLPRPDLPSLLGWIGIGFAVLFVLITAVGLRLPAWAGWLAIIGFVGALGVLIARLPRQRPPGDGAVL